MGGILMIANQKVPDASLSRADTVYDRDSVDGKLPSDIFFMGKVIGQAIMSL
jgi:hypothetical protein